MSASVAQQKKDWTEAELQALPKGAYDHEVVDGQLILSPKNNVEHGDIAVRLLTALSAFVSARRLGIVLDSSTGFWMVNRNCRAPDISFIAKERLRGLTKPPTTFFEGAPDLAVEVLAPSNTPQEMTERLTDYFESGTKLAWVIHPREQFVEICRSVTAREILGVGAVLDGQNVVPQFQFPIAELFVEWNWD